MSEQSHIKRVTIEFTDKVMVLEGGEAAKWEQHNIAIATIADVHGMNPFSTDKIKWTEFVKTS